VLAGQVAVAALSRLIGTGILRLCPRSAESELGSGGEALSFEL
jgi:hypothetical protein